jgi:hypothetical protein
MARSLALFQCKNDFDFASSNTVVLGKPFEGFTPNAGGQTTFFDLVPIDRIVEIEPKWVALRGGIGCIAGETEINGIPVKELTKTPIKVQTLMGEQWATPAFLKGQADIYRVTTQQGRQILVTEEHRFLSPTGWHQLKSLGCGAIVACHDTAGDRQHLGKSKDSQSHYQRAVHCGGELSHPTIIFALEKFGLLSSQRNGTLCTHARQTIANYDREFLPHSIAVQHHAAQAAAESLPQSLRSLYQSPRKFDRLCTETRSDPSADRSSPYIEHCLSPHSRHEFGKRGALLRQKPQSEPQSRGRSGSVDKTPGWNHREPFAPLLCDEACKDHACRESVAIWCGSSQSFSRKPEYSDYFSIPESLRTLTPEQIISWIPLSGGNGIYDNSYWDVIESIEYVRHDDFYDLHVPFANHYLAQGFWNHNSGKSACGAAFACSRALLDSSSRGLISANDYQQLRTSTLVALAEFCFRFNIPLRPFVDGDADATAEAIANKRSCKIFDAHVLVISANKFTGTTKKAKEGGRGLQIRWFWGDEWAYADASAFNTVNGRLGRGEGVLKALGLVTSSPNKNQPYNWLYDYFDDPGRNADRASMHRSIVLDTRENLKYLGEDYVKSLETAYTDELALIELRGQYATLSSGRVYKYFDRQQHILKGNDGVVLGYDRALDIHLSFDFNWNPATCIAAQLRGDELVVVKEFKLSNSDTFEMGEAVVEWLRSERHKTAIYFYGDASGNSRSANSKLTNWQILWGTFRDANYDPIRRYGASNPGVLDSVLSVNNLFKQGRLYLVDRCLELAKDLEQVQWSDDAGTTIDKSNSDHTHLSDTLRYLVHTLFSYKKQTTKPAKAQIRIEGLPV